MNKLFKLLRIIFVLLSIVIIYFNFSDILLFSNVFNNNNCDNCSLEIQSSMSTSIIKKLENLKIIKEKVRNDLNEENYKSYFYILFDCNNYAKCEEKKESQNIRKNCIDKNLNFCFFDFEYKEKIIKKKSNFYNYCVNSLEQIDNKDFLCKKIYKLKEENEKNR